MEETETQHFHHEFWIFEPVWTLIYGFEYTTLLWSSKKYYKNMFEQIMYWKMGFGNLIFLTIWENGGGRGGSDDWKFFWWVQHNLC